jgi:hypothetical protein
VCSQVIGQWCILKKLLPALNLNAALIGSESHHVNWDEAIWDIKHAAPDDL